MVVELLLASSVINNCVHIGNQPPGYLNLLLNVGSAIIVFAVTLDNGQYHEQQQRQCFQDNICH